MNDKVIQCFPITYGAKSYISSWVDILKDKSIDIYLRMALFCRFLTSYSRLIYLDQVKNIQVAGFFNSSNEFVVDDHVLLTTLSEADYFINLCNNFSKSDINFKELFYQSNRLVANTQKKRQRLKRFIENYCFLNDRFCYFITKTFDDEALKNTFENRKKQVIRELKKIDGLIAYALNVDYGEENGREHFHIVLSCKNRIDFSKYSTDWDFETCKNSVSDKEAISSYIIKLASHGVKMSTRNKNISYYPKNWNKLLKNGGENGS